MNRAAIFHQPYDAYCYPLDRDELRVSIRTGKDVTAVILVYGDPFQREESGGQWRWRSRRAAMDECRELPDNLFWSCTVRPEFKRCTYYFEIHAGEEALLKFENVFLTPGQLAAAPESAAPYIFPWMNPADIIAPPRWAGDTVWYQIFPSRFCRGGADARQDGLLPWGTADQAVTNSDRFGGNLAGITEKLDYLRELGINGLYLNPVNAASSQHKYDTTDYYRIDPDFGTEEDMRRLVREAHARGIRVMVDGVFNHSGWDFFAWQDVLKNRRQSRYKDWYMVNDYDFPPRPGHHSAEGKYYSFAFVDCMPKLNTSNPEVRDYLAAVCEHWVRQYGIDAIRLDVANELSHEFCRQLRRRLRSIKEDFFLAGEIWTDSLPWLRGAEFDSVINYPLRTAIYTFAVQKEQTAHELEQQLNQCLTMYPRQVERALINQMDSHDTPRLITKAGGSKDLALLQFALLLALPGSACLYYGTEVLLPGGQDPDCRRCMPWDEIGAGRFSDELHCMKTLIRLRREHDALRGPDVTFAHPRDGRLVAFWRQAAPGGERILCAFNFGTAPWAAPAGTIPLFARHCASEGETTTVQPGGFALLRQEPAVRTA